LISGDLIARNDCLPKAQIFVCEAEMGLTFFADERIFRYKTETQYNIQDIDPGGENNE